MSPVPALDIVIVSYRCRDLLVTCLESLQTEAATVPLHVVVVDNASGDGTVELVRERFPEVELVESGGNVGFGRATNAGIRRGTAPYVLALNPDTRVRPAGLAALLALMESNERIGIAGPRLVRHDGTLDHAARRSFPTPLGALSYFLGVTRIRRRGRLAQYLAPDIERGPVDAVNGAFMLMRRSALVEVGLFDEGYWMYMEDLDLGYRMAQAGWVTWYEPDVTVEHVKHGSSGDWRAPKLNYAFHYGMFRFYRKHYAGSRNPLLNVAVYGGIAVKLAFSLVKTGVRRRVRPA